MRRRLIRLFVVLALVAVPLAVEAQRRGGLGRFGGMFLSPSEAPTYDGRFTLGRLYYPLYSGWSFDWPDMETHLARIVEHITALRPSHDLNNIIRMDDPELLKFPVTYLSEPGSWFPMPSEVQGLRTYLAKGGFLIVDDFHFPEEWSVFEQAMRQVLPNARIERLDVSHPVFNSFFPIQSLEVPYPGRLGQQGLMGEFYGIHDESHPSRRLMVVINYNMDIGDYMEHSPDNRYAVAPTNEAYKFGINYLIYGLTR